MRALFIMYYFEIQVMVFDWFDLNGFKWFDFYESKLMLLLQNVVVMEQKTAQYGKNLQLVCVWWHN